MHARDVVLIVRGVLRSPLIGDRTIGRRDLPCAFAGRRVAAILTLELELAKRNVLQESRFPQVADESFLLGG